MKILLLLIVLLIVSFPQSGHAVANNPAVSPVFESKNICPDTPLRIVFPSAPTLASRGNIKVFDAADNKLIEDIDTTSTVSTQTIGGQENYKYYPVTIAGNEVTIHLRNQVLEYNKTYYATIDPEVFGDVSRIFESAHPVWRFSTKVRAPNMDSHRLVVATDGSGDFCTVQGALDFIPKGNTTPTTLFLRKGTYNEMVSFTDKHAITFQGEDRKQSVIAYATNNKFNDAHGVYHRGVLMAIQCNDLVFSNLTIRNTTPQGGSQAEAIILNGSQKARAIVKNVDLYSYQDTLQINGQAYVSDCYIEGDVDFIWGTGPCYFENCECYSVRSNAYYTQIRNPKTNHGYVYFHCTFDGAPGITGNYLSRIAPTRFPASEVVLIDCVTTPAVGAMAWKLDGEPVADLSALRFLEFNSHDANGQPVDVSKRLQSSHQLKQPDDAELIRNYSDPAFVLGDGWNPRTGKK